MSFVKRSLINTFLLSICSAAAAQTQNQNLNTLSSTTCSQLSSALPQKVFYSDAETYNASITSYPFLQLRLSPTCIVRPNTTEDVATALEILTANNRTRFAVKGGGHNTNTGFNNIQDGITIDMQSLNHVEVEKGDQVVRAGAGALAQDLYDAADKRNVTVLGPRIGVVGAGGFTTGGGISFLSPKHGWACDSVINFEVVLPNGTIINANSTSNPDLHVALRGGQNNFGIVTRFDLQAYPQGRIFGGRTVYGPQVAEDLFSAYSEFKKPENYDEHAPGWVTVHYNHTEHSFIPVAIFWHTKPEEKPGALKQIWELQPQVIDGKAEGSIGEHTRNASRMVKQSITRTIWATTSFHNSPTILHKIYALWKQHVPEILESYADLDPASELTFQSIPPPQNGTNVNSLGLSSSTYSADDGKDLIFAQVLFSFDDASANEALHKALKDLIEKIDEITEEEGVRNKFIYLNFAAWFQDPLGSYGKEQKKALRDAARKYDPEGVFQSQVPGGFKLF